MEGTYDLNGTKIWRNNVGELHRDNDLPAAEYSDGAKFWYQHGKKHRNNDLPAVEYPDGNHIWYQNGVKHRDNDLPAEDYVARNDLGKIMPPKINGRYYYENDMPSNYIIIGDRRWFKHGKLHRDNDLPAYIDSNGVKQWYVDGKLHRLGGLGAHEYYSYAGHKYCEWYIYGRKHERFDVLISYHILTRFGRYCLRKIRPNHITKTNKIHNELLCMPPNSKYLGGQDYHKALMWFL